jgi:glucans biosynthesis protein
VLGLLHPGFFFKTPVQINLREPGGRVVAIPFSKTLFSYGKDVTPPEEDSGLAFSGFRARYPINRPDVLDEVIVFQGASYFRAIARNQRYGISARGLAVKTASADGEEFPAFIRFWVERPEPEADALTVHALLDSTSVTGAYSFVVRPGEETVTEVELDLFPRTDLTDIGIAPLTSMFLFDSSNRNRFDDYRNAVHDSDGLQMLTGLDERIWRPLANPPELQVSMFVDENPQGFGLVQRKRRFGDYQDNEARYELRPSTWVEPLGDWGRGFVELVEIPTDREIHDNIVAFWRPRDTLTAGRSYHFAYRLHWCDAPPDVTPVARVAATRSGRTFDGEHRLFVVDFAIPTTVPADLKPVVTVSTGQVVEVTGELVESTSRYRVSVSFEPEDSDLSEFRLQLVSGGEPWSETWLYRWTK